MINVVIDTNVFVSALMSTEGASFRVLSLIDSGKFQVNVSIPLVVEYESAAKRFLGTKIQLSEKAVDDLIDYFCSVAQRHNIHFLWRPILNDPRDELVLELAVSAECQFIVTHNISDFQGSEQFGVSAITPKEFLARIGGLP